MSNRQLFSLGQLDLVERSGVLQRELKLPRAALHKHKGWLPLEKADSDSFIDSKEGCLGKGKWGSPLSNTSSQIFSREFP